MNEHSDNESWFVAVRLGTPFGRHGNATVVERRTPHGRLCVAFVDRKRDPGPHQCGLARVLRGATSLPIFSKVYIRNSIYFAAAFAGATALFLLAVALVGHRWRYEER